VPIAEVADAASGGELLGVAGIGMGGVFLALWNVEKDVKARLEEQVQQLQVMVVMLSVAVAHGRCVAQLHYISSCAMTILRTCFQNLLHNTNN
jgi:hypothetical protein